MQDSSNFKISSTRAVSDSPEFQPANSRLLERICEIAGSVSREKADRVCESQRGGTRGSIFGAGKIDALDEIEAAAVEEHVDHKPAFVRAVDAGNTFKPSANGICGETESIGNASAAAIQGDKASVDGRAARFDARGRN